MVDPALKSLFETQPCLGRARHTSAIYAEVRGWHNDRPTPITRPCWHNDRPTPITRPCWRNDRTTPINGRCVLADLRPRPDLALTARLHLRHQHAALLGRQLVVGGLTEHQHLGCVDEAAPVKTRGPPSRQNRNGVAATDAGMDIGS